MKPEYGWIITEDKLEEKRTRAGERPLFMGPRGVTFSAEEIRTRGEKFRLLDDDREIYYVGYWIDAGGEGDPLADFGTPYAGCTMLEILKDGEWELCIG